MEITRVDIIRKHYALALQNFLYAFQGDSRTKVVATVVETIDEIATKHNWHIASTAMLEGGLWKKMREDIPFHMTLIKFEHMCLALMTMEGMRDEFVNAMQAMLMLEPYAVGIVDKDFSKTTEPMVGFSVSSVPGLIGMLSVLVFRDMWVFQQRA